MKLIGNLITLSENNIYQQLLKNKSPFPGLIRILDHLNEKINFYSLDIINFILFNNVNHSKLSSPHQDFDKINDCDGINKFFSIFRK